MPATLAAPVGEERPSAFALKLAEAVLKPLLGRYRGNLACLKTGDNALSFELNGVPDSFAPQAGTVVTAVKPAQKGVSETGSSYYVVDIKGYLVQLFAHPVEASRQATVSGAIYTGPDRDAALKFALKHAKRLLAS